jgi:hypothetical protein
MTGFDRNWTRLARSVAPRLARISSPCRFIAVSAGEQHCGAGCLTVFKGLRRKRPFSGIVVIMQLDTRRFPAAFDFVESVSR